MLKPFEERSLPGLLKNDLDGQITFEYECLYKCVQDSGIHSIEDLMTRHQSAISVDELLNKNIPLTVTRFEEMELELVLLMPPSIIWL